MMWVVTVKSGSAPLTASSKIIPIFYFKKEKKQKDTNSSFDIAGIQSFISRRRYKFACPRRRWLHRKLGEQPGSPSWSHQISAELQEAAGPRWAPTNAFCPGAARTTGLHPGGSCCLMTWDAAPLLRKLQPFPKKGGDNNPWPSEGDLSRSPATRPTSPRQPRGGNSTSCANSTYLQPKTRISQVQKALEGQKCWASPGQHHPPTTPQNHLIQGALQVYLSNRRNKK